MVLVVDDEVAVAQMICEALESRGLRVTHCHDAAQAVLQAEGVTPALLIADIMMPAWGSGVDAFRRLRARKRFQRLPVIFLTGMHSEMARKVVPDDDPMVRLLFKPVTLAKLMLTIRELTGDRLLGPAPKAKEAKNG